MNCITQLQAVCFILGAGQGRILRLLRLSYRGLCVGPMSFAYGGSEARAPILERD